MVGIFKNRIVGIVSEYCGMMQCQRSRLHTQRQLYTENKASEDRSYSGVCHEHAAYEEAANPVTLGDDAWALRLHSPCCIQVMK